MNFKKIYYFLYSMLLSILILMSGSLYAVNEPLDCSIEPPTSSPSQPNVCEPLPDVSDYQYIEGDWTLSAEEVAVGNYYVNGSVVLSEGKNKNETQIQGNLYAVGDIFMDNHTYITGFAYTQDGVVYHNQGGQNNIIEGGTCECGDQILPKPPVDLPVDELIEQCNEIFPDAVQSFATASELFMQNNTQILDSTTNLFPFSSIAGFNNGGPPANSCGTGIQCGITSPPSQALSAFSITANNNGKSFALWQSEQVELGGTAEANDLYNGTIFQSITAGGSSTITFLPLDYDQNEMFQVDTLVVQETSTVKLSAGVYAVNSLKLDPGATIDIVGDGDVYLFVERIDQLNGILSNNSTSRFFVIVNEGFSINSSGSLNASLYSTGNILLGVSLHLNGQVTAQNLTLQGSVKIQSNLICGDPQPPVGSNQFIIETGSNALTCEAHPVTLKVLDSNGLPDTNYIGTVNLSVTDTALNSGIGDWSMSSDNGRLTNNGNGNASYEFNGTEAGMVTLQLSVSTVSEVSVSMSQDALSAEPAIIDFQSSLIKVEKCSVPATSNLDCLNTDADPAIANRPFKLKLTAMKSDETQTCINYDPDNIAFWSEYKSIHNNKVVTIDGNDLGTDLGSAIQLPLAFSAGVATVTANYPDAGKIQINVQDTGVDEISGSIESIINPLKLVIDGVVGRERNNDGRTNGPGLVRASVPDYTDLQVDTFDMTVKAIIDCTTSGVSGNCGDGINTIAKSFTNKINLIISLIGDYELGNLAYEDNLEVDLSDGQFTYTDLAYSEAGTFGAEIESEDYLITGNNITTDTVETIGYFYPDYLTWESYQLIATCNNDFSYLGQQSAELSYTLRANNQAASPSVTVNYDDSRGYPVAPTDNFSNSVFAGTTELTSRLLLAPYYDQENWSLGNYIIPPQLVGIDRNTNLEGAYTPDGPYFVNDNPAEYWIALQGVDGEKIKDVANNTSCSETSCALGNLGDLVYGRLQAGNSHGSEFEPIRAMIEATYFDGEEFVLFNRDDCTTLLNEQLSTTPEKNGNNEIVVGNSSTSLSILNSPLISGKGYLQFTAPDDRGTVDYFIRLKDLADSGLYAPWLLDSSNAVTCPDETGILTDCISGQVNFGLFRGNDRIIYRMQTFD